MKKFFALAGFSALFISAITTYANPERPLYYGKYSTEATLKFTHKVIISQVSEPAQRTALKAINSQVAFLFGSMDLAEIRGSPKTDHQIIILGNEKLVTGEWAVKYQYIGTILTEKPTSAKYQLRLPRNPSTIYGDSIIVRGEKVFFPCSSDPDHNEEEYYWYFWDVEGYGCKLAEGVHYDTFFGDVQLKANTRVSYPEYQRLVHNGALSVHLLIGMDDPYLSKDPLVSRDLNANTYRNIRQYLLTNGFEVRQWTKADLANRKLTLYELPFVEEFTKQTPNAKLEFRLFFGPVDSYDGLGFQKLLADAVANSSVMVYDGHSGLGEYLNMERISSIANVKFTAPLDRYQIYFFNGCSTYPYYGAEYFALKQTEQDPRGTKNLDIMTNGLATLFTAMIPSNLIFVKAIEKWAETGVKTSYQDIINAADTDNLLGINGDEDNK